MNQAKINSYVIKHISEADIEAVMSVLRADFLTKRQSLPFLKKRWQVIATCDIGLPINILRWRIKLFTYLYGLSKLSQKSKINNTVPVVHI